jgi:hypothetical protein
MQLRRQSNVQPSAISPLAQRGRYRLVVFRKVRQDIFDNLVDLTHGGVQRFAMSGNSTTRPMNDPSSSDHAKLFRSGQMATS